LFNAQGAKSEGFAYSALNQQLKPAESAVGSLYSFNTRSQGPQAKNGTLKRLFISHLQNWLWPGAVSGTAKA
jgi:hypothetical protein